MNRRANPIHWFMGHLRRCFGAGLLLLAPVFITYYILRFAFNIGDSILQPAIERFTGWHIPGLGIATLIIIIFVFGFVATSIIGKKVVHLIQEALLRIPIIKTVYSPAAKLIETLGGTGSTGIQHVVVIEYPRIGTWMLGFLTSITSDEKGAILGVVYLPTAPTPNSGYVAILPVEDIYETDLSVQETMKLILSGGITTPLHFTKRPLDRSSYASDFAQSDILSDSPVQTSTYVRTVEDQPKLDEGMKVRHGEANPTITTSPDTKRPG